jgi:hypothetical protein
MLSYAGRAPEFRRLPRHFAARRQPDWQSAFPAFVNPREDNGTHAPVGRTPAAMWPDKLRSRPEIATLLLCGASHAGPSVNDD